MMALMPTNMNTSHRGLSKFFKGSSDSLGSHGALGVIGYVQIRKALLTTHSFVCV